MGRAKGAGARRMAMVTATLVAGVFVAPLALAEETPSEARCEYPPDGGAGAAGAGAAVSHVGWQTQWVQLCVQTTAPGEADQAADRVFPGDAPGCDQDDRRAIEVYASRDAAELERKASCDDTQPAFMPSPRTYHEESCTTAVSTGDGVTATDSCANRWWGDPDGSGGASWSEGESDGTTTEVQVGDDAITVTRSGYAASGGDPYGQGSTQLTVGADGVAYDAHSESDFGSCDDSASLQIADPTAAALPELDCL